MPSSCLRFLRRANSSPKVEARCIQNGMKKSSTVYKVRAERACSLCRAKQRHEVTLYKVRAERACSLCRAKQRHEVTSPIRFSEEPIFLRCIRIGFMLLKAACERRGVHFSATLSEPSTGRFLHLRRVFVVPSFYLRFCPRAVIAPRVGARGKQNGMKKGPRHHLSI